MRQKIVFWVEEYLFFPNTFQRFISILLLPLTAIYTTIVILKRIFSKKKDFNIPVISVGNLIIGGSGKTPFIIALANRYKNSCVILRGYGRESTGLYIIKDSDGNILDDIKISGDEAKVIAQSVKECMVIVSEDRQKAIIKAKELGAKIIFLDDGFSKVDIKKFDILLRSKNEPTNSFCIPSGGYREPKYLYKKAHLVLKEGVDFKRVVTYSFRGERVLTLPKKLALITAISKPKRVLEYLPDFCELIAFEDHHNFTKDEIEKIRDSYKGFTFITTRKDYVKLLSLGESEFYIMELELEFNKSVEFSKLNFYIDSYKQ